MSVPPRLGQTFLTICMQCEDEGQFAATSDLGVAEMIDALGNPANAVVKAKIDALGIVHFMSLHIIPAAVPPARSTLLLEASVDGDADQAINAIATALRDELFPIVRRACGLTDPDALARLMRRSNRPLSQTLLRGRRTAHGLPFQGLPGLSVADIKAQQILANDARAALAQVEGPGTGPITLLRAVKAAVAPTLTPTDSLKPAFADTRDAPWLLKANGGGEGALRRYLKIGSVELSGPLIAMFLLSVFAVGYALGFWPVVKLLNSIGTAFGLPVDPTTAIDWGDPVRLIAGFLSDALTLLVVIAISILTTLVLFAAFAASFVALLRARETANLPVDLDPDPKVVAAMMARENAPGVEQNHMISVTNLQAGWLRLVTLLLAFRIVGGSLGAGIARFGFLNTVGTVQYARWFVVPGTRQMVFVSNFDGSWESYLEDFIKHATMGVNGIWGNTRGFPATRLLFLDGCKDGDRFKRFARRSMSPTYFWYSAYPDLSADRIRKQALVHDGLCRIGDRASDAQAWLQLFDSIPRPDRTVEHAEVQNLLYGGLKNLCHSECLVIDFANADVVKLRRLVRHLQGLVTFGDAKPAEKAVFVAFTANGLAKLGLGDASSNVGDFPVPGHNRYEEDAPEKAPPERFPPAFALGMAHPSRSRLLGDPAAEAWAWGAADATDAALLLYAATPELLATMDTDLRGQLAAADVRCAATIATGRGTAANDAAQQEKEPFGFADGLSQPMVRGLSRSGYDASSIHAVEPGEFLLGYADNRGYFPPTPQVPESDDPHCLLAALPAELPLRWPFFGQDEKQDRESRDFGRNGSYLVIRQIAQDIQAFEHYCAAQARVHLVTPAFVGAKIMGRWHNGTSLVQYPEAPGNIAKARDNEFRFAVDDPQGQRCPLGSHIRRANPRDSLNPVGDTELATVNRHRLLRRGRAYRGDGGEQGILFMCFNADIERQFEFVQKSWLLAPSFHGLANELDAIVAPRCPAGNKLTVATDSRAIEFAGMPSFTQLRGGGYFFLPGRRSLAFLAADPQI